MQPEHAHTAAEAVVAATSLLRWIPLLPLIGFGVGVFAASTNRRSLVHVTGPGSVLLAFVVSVIAVSQLWALPAGGALVDNVYTWISVGMLKIDLTFRVDALTSVMLLIITGIGFLIHLYALGYMHDDADEARFFSYLNLFVASMLVLVLADSLPVVFIGWEGVGVCSYLLIGFWYQDMANADAGRKAMLTNRVGDAAFLIGMFMLVWALHDLGAASLRFEDVNRMAPQLGAAAPHVVTAVCLLLLIGATGKSAQIPLYVWLPDAMAGPTPVSALIHAATMVTAGVYMIARLSPLYVLSPAALDVVATIGAVTALFAATMALVQNDLKKILAYSTISQIGYMVLGVGVGSFSGGVFHLMTHACFKALLFLGAGSVMHAMSGELDVHKMGGLKKQLPTTRWTFLVGCLAIAGVPPLAAFFSKDMILEAAFASGHVVLWLIGLAAAGMTAFYMFRAYFLAFEGESRVDHHAAHHLHESPSTMTIPLMVLAVLSIVAGWVGLPHGVLWGDRFGHYLAPVLAPHDALGHHEIGGGTVLLLTLVTTGVAALGIFVAYSFYLKSPGTADRLAERFRGVYVVLWNKYWVDEIYDRLIITPYVIFSKFFWKVVDAMLIDGVVNGAGVIVGKTSDVWRRLESGNVQHYAAAMMLGAVVTCGVYWWLS
ncbi:MAG: NADH-quinone oxidoreductase subunit L [Deltaproteobacteria bacterium]|nr:NADH-quinone oxidoreductase subunit L [Deltaproteobacteria bacterium]